MALAAVVTAWASFEGSQWDSRSDESRSASALLRSDATRAAADAVTQSVVDASVWLEWEKAVILGRDDFAAFTRDRFSPALDAAQDEWLKRTRVDEDGNPVDGTLPQGTPLALDVYMPPSQLKAEELSAAAEAKLADADVAGQIGTRYTEQVVLLALCLFFASVATKFTDVRLQLALALIAFGALALVSLRMAELPVLR